MKMRRCCFNLIINNKTTGNLSDTGKILLVSSVDNHLKEWKLMAFLLGLGKPRFKRTCL
jgi:hypothetical protein